MKKFRCFMQIAYSPNNALITVSCRLRGGCERLLMKWVISPLPRGVAFMIAGLLLGASGASAGRADASLTSLKQSFRRPLDIPFPPENLYSPEKAELGKVLFFAPGQKPRHGSERNYLWRPTLPSRCLSAMCQMPTNSSRVL